MADCRHLDIFESTVTTREGSFTSGFCWDCGVNWRSERLNDSAAPDPDAEQLAGQVGALAGELRRVG